MKDDGSLPPASDLVDEALDTADLNRFLKAAIRALPDSVVNAALKTDDVLIRTIDDLDLRSLLANLDNQHDLDQQINAAVDPGGQGLPRRPPPRPPPLSLDPPMAGVASVTSRVRWQGAGAKLYLYVQRGTATPPACPNGGA